MSAEIAIIDDSQLVLDMAKECLTEAGFRVRAFAKMSEAEEIGQVRLILVDVQMPELFGDDLAMVLRFARGHECPIYLYSSLPASELEESATQAGVDGFICKHEGLDHLVERVKSIFAEQEN
jgi:DNA-binding response OmpR family regulator